MKLRGFQIASIGNFREMLFITAIIIAILRYLSREREGGGGRGERTQSVLCFRYSEIITFFRQILYKYLEA